MEEGQERRIQLNSGRAQLDEYFIGNEVVTAKYTWYSFLPKNLWEQLHKFGNVYFLFISVVMYLGETTDLYVGTIRAFSTLGLLVMMMAVTAAVALYDDIQRGRADKEINMSIATVLVEGREVEKKFKDLQVGDILIVKKDQDFPADTIPLHCSGEGGNCYVSTANLDGETNLKLKTAPSITQKALMNSSGSPAGSLSMLKRIEIVAEAPNGNIHDFNGNITVENQKASLGQKQLLMRGTVLRNTDKCTCVIVYTGNDTRMVKNSRPAPMKQSNLEITTNKAMFIVLFAQTLISLTCGFLHIQFKPKHHWYLEEERIILPEWLAWWLTFFTLFSNLMPISLYPTVEFCNAFQCRAIRLDEKMHYKFPDSNELFEARTRSTNLSQELGQVGYVFSDKTGTLTQNDMILRRLSIGGKKYGTFSSGPSFAKDKKMEASEPPDAGFNGGKFLEADRSSNRSIDRFLEILAVSHTVMATKKDGELIYEAESPDEYALVKAAAVAGFEFKSRSGSDATVSIRPHSQDKSQDVTYSLLATNEFNSARKRMSVLVKKGAEYLLLVKGADNVMLERAAQRNQAVLEAHLQEFAEEGLRTLVIGCRTIPMTEATSWLNQFQEAQRATADREEKLGQVAEQIEKSLEIVGATAIEDKLQDGVPDTIQLIRDAGIKLWVLTGDKLETARNIGFSTRVLSTSMDIRILDDELGEDIDAIENAWECYSDVSDQEEEVVRSRALMVTGKMVSLIWESDGADDSLKKKFQRISTSCAVLIACRVSPLQKAELVSFIRENVTPTPVTLAVGDGANDVPMIQTAQVGVGIAGREGRQAVNNSDFAIGQFRFLERLLLLHGRWNYRRACMFTLFTFWRNMVQVLMIVFYTFISGYSGTSLFEDWIRLTFNGVCTMPILPPGCMDQDFREQIILKNPKQYQVGPNSEDLNSKKVAMTISVAVLHAFVIVVITLLAFPGLEIVGSGDYYTFGTICYTCLILDVNYRAIFLSNNNSRSLTIWVALAAFLLYSVYLLVYTNWPWLCNKLTPNMFKVPDHMSASAYFWICIFIVPFTAFVYDTFFHWVYHTVIDPDRADRLRIKLENDEHSRSLLDCRLTSESSDEEMGSASEGEGLMARCGASEFESLEMMNWMNCDKVAYDTRVFSLAIAGGVVMELLALLCWSQSSSKNQVRIIYD
ncbi:Phospholipid-transporting ATPase IB (ATPase class I type 8A member 2) (P4-ATPase flippase complex alpha subunit ATP8A2), partial [Durusdinium trenchii]